MQLLTHVPVYALADRRQKVVGWDNWHVFTPAMIDDYGTHHSKFAIVVTRSLCRVCIHTANYVPHDWHSFSQGAWIQDFPLKPAGAALSTSTFESELLRYLAATQAFQPGGWSSSSAGGISLSSLSAFDFSAAKAQLVCSTPGRHSGAAIAQQGHMHVRSLLQNHAPGFPALFRRSPLLFSFSSMSGMGRGGNGAVPPWLEEIVESFSAGNVCLQRAGVH